jgi:hypothetical protein
MIAVDTTSLSLLFVPNAPVYGWKTKKPVPYAKERMEFLVNSIAKTNGKILIPTPVLSEIIVRLSPAQTTSLLATLNASSWFTVEAFDSIAAVELGVRTAKAIAEGDKKEGSEASWTKVKFDRQIVSIAMVNHATEILSDDADIAAICERWGFKIVSVADLLLPPELIPPPLLQGLDPS